MGLQIEDGQGSGRSVKVDHENRLGVTSVTSTVERHINEAEGKAFNLIFAQTPTYLDPSTADTGDVCFIYMKNNSSELMILENIDIRLSGTGQSTIIKIVGSDGGNPVGGTQNTPSNLNLGSGHDADGTFLVGNQITGLSGGTELYRFYVGSSNDISSFNFEQDIIVPKNKVITVYSSEIDNEIGGQVVFNFHELYE